MEATPHVEGEVVPLHTTAVFLIGAFTLVALILACGTYRSTCALPAACLTTTAASRLVFGVPLLASENRCGAGSVWVAGQKTEKEEEPVAAVRFIFSWVCVPSMWFEFQELFLSFSCDARRGCGCDYVENFLSLTEATTMNVCHNNTRLRRRHDGVHAKALHGLQEGSLLGQELDLNNTTEHDVSGKTSYHPMPALR